MVPIHAGGPGAQPDGEGVGAGEPPYRGLFEHMAEGCAWCRMLYEGGEPADFVYLAVNAAFESLTGLAGVVGRRVTEVIPGIRERDPEVLALYGRVARTGVPERTEVHVASLGHWFSVSAYCTSPEHFVAVFDVISERKRVEAELRRSQERMHLALEAAHSGIWEWDLATDAYLWSDELWALFGLEPGSRKPSFETWLELVHPDSRAGVAASIKASVAACADLDVEWRTALPERSERWMMARGRPQRDARGRVTRYLGVTTDITQHKQVEDALRHSEDALRASEAELRTVVENSRDGIDLLDLATGRYVFMSPAQVELTGFSREELNQIGAEEALERVHPDDRHISLEQQRQIASGTDDIRRAEYRWKVKSGEYRWFSDSRGLVRDPAGRPVAMVGIRRDITEARRAEAALRESELENRERTAELEAANRTLRTIRSCTEELVRATSEEGLLRGVCRVLQEQGGYRFAWMAPAEDAPAATGDGTRVGTGLARPTSGGGMAARCLRSGMVCARRDFASDPELRRWRREASSFGYGACAALPLRTNGRVFGALTLYAESPDAFGPAQVGLLTGLAEDLALGLTVLRAREEVDRLRAVAERRSTQLRSLSRELNLAEQREKQRLSQLLHDGLQQQLVGAKFRIGALERSCGAHLRPVVEELNELICESLESSRSLAYELSPPVLTRSGLLPALEWLSGWMKSRHGLKVRFQARCEPPPVPEDTAILLYQATRELLFNVVKHAKVGTATLEVAREGPELHIRVCDRGRGFDPDQLQAVGGAFGGLGLPSIRERLDSLGGRLEMDAAPRHGSRFTLVAPLPASGEQEAAPAPERKRAKTGGRTRRPRTSKIRILLVDDHVVMRKGLAELLRAQPDLEVVAEASDGESALALAAKARPEVVLMDMNLPGISGLRATELLRREQPAVRVIGLSMLSASERADAMLEAGAVAYCSKDSPPDSLIATIRSCVRSAV